MKFAIYALAALLLAGHVYGQPMNNLVQEYLDEGIEWVSELSYDKQVPPINGSRATGTAYYTLIDTTDYLAINFTIYIANTNVLGVSNDNRTFDLAHIHVGGPTTSGPVLVVLFSNSTGGPARLRPPVTNQAEFLLAKGTITPKSLALPGWDFESLLEAMDNGTLYTNVHTSRYPNGELRGQVEPAISEPSVPLTVQSISA